MQNYTNQFLPNALRKFFEKIEAPRQRDAYLSLLVELFSKRYFECNQNSKTKLRANNNSNDNFIMEFLDEDTIYILCFSLILLSVDLTSPAVKNKMSKREFIKNTRFALPNLNPDFTGHLYDNVYLNGSVANRSRIDEDLFENDNHP